MHYDLRDEIRYTFPNFNGGTVEVGECIMIPFHTFLGMWLFIDAGIIVNHVSKMGVLLYY